MQGAVGLRRGRGEEADEFTRADKKKLILSGGFGPGRKRGLLSILPQRNALGYNIGYYGGGPHALAAYLTQVADTDGQNTAAGASYEQAHPAILAWTQSSAADRGANLVACRCHRSPRAYKGACRPGGQGKARDACFSDSEDVPVGGPAGE